MLSFVSVMGWDGMQGGEGTCGTGRGWRVASGFLDGNGVRREMQETHRREVAALPWGTFSKARLRLQAAKEGGYKRPEQDGRWPVYVSPDWISVQPDLKPSTEGWVATRARGRNSLQQTFR